MAEVDAAAAEIPEVAYVAATLALHGDCSCESPDEHDELSEGCSSLAETALIAAWPHVKAALVAEATAWERQRIAHDLERILITHVIWPEDSADAIYALWHQLEAPE